MRIAFYAPFKPVDHPNPSGDRTIARGLIDFLSGCGHQTAPISRLRTRWIFWKPHLWPRVFLEQGLAGRRLERWRPDIWLTYHTYYKAPDLLGPRCAAKSRIPYVIFQGIYSTKRRKRLKSLPGFWLNRHALLSARLVFTNRREDEVNLKRLLPESRIRYIPPGIIPAAFRFDAAARHRLRAQWRIGETPVILSAAMCRPGVKARGVEWVIRSCARLKGKGIPFHLVIAGDGREKPRLMALGQALLSEQVRFTGRIDRSRMGALYSAADLFAFPGIRESLGMVYLESQSCGLPVVAFRNGGVPEVVQHGETGLLTPPFDAGAFDHALQMLSADPDRRQRMGTAARQYVRTTHDQAVNYRRVEGCLHSLLERKP